MSFAHNFLKLYFPLFLTFTWLSDFEQRCENVNQDVYTSTCGVSLESQVYAVLKPSHNVTSPGNDGDQLEEIIDIYEEVHDYLEVIAWLYYRRRSRNFSSARGGQTGKPVSKQTLTTMLLHLNFVIGFTMALWSSSSSCLTPVWAHAVCGAIDTDRVSHKLRKRTTIGTFIVQVTRCVKLSWGDAWEFYQVFVRWLRRIKTCLKVTDSPIHINIR